MTVDEIKNAVEAGKKVFWCNPAYEVVKDKIGQFLIYCNMTDSCIGLTWRDGVTLNGAEDEFYIGD